MAQTTEDTVYLGPRGQDFSNLIIGLLRRGNLKSKYNDNIL